MPRGTNSRSPPRRSALAAAAAPNGWRQETTGAPVARPRFGSAPSSETMGFCKPNEAPPFGGPTTLGFCPAPFDLGDDIGHVPGAGRPFLTLTALAGRRRRDQKSVCPAQERQGSAGRRRPARHFRHTPKGERCAAFVHVGQAPACPARTEISRNRAAPVQSDAAAQPFDWWRLGLVEEGLGRRALIRGRPAISPSRRGPPQRDARGPRGLGNGPAE